MSDLQRRILEASQDAEAEVHEDSELQMYATEPPGAMSEEDDWITVEQMEGICPECAGNMRERKMTKIRTKEAIESGLVEYDETEEVEQVEEVDEAKRGKDGWPKKLKTGRFTEYCKGAGFKGPGIECARKAMQSDDASVRGMASFYMNTVKPGGKTASAIKGKDEAVPEEMDPGPNPTPVHQPSSATVAREGIAFSNEFVFFDGHKIAHKDAASKQAQVKESECLREDAAERANFIAQKLTEAGYTVARVDTLW